MSRNLCISVTFLDQLFHGMADDRPEWPPSPMRLFQALLAGARTGCHVNDWSQAKDEAFRWLERLEPPLIVGPEALQGRSYRLAVPNNDSDVPGSYWARGVEPPDNRLPSSLRAMKEMSPRWLLGKTIHYLWPIEEHKWTESRPHAELLCMEARHLLALGRGIDQAVANGGIVTDAEAAALPGERWRPWTGHWPGAPTWRVPQEGSLQDLEQVHQSFLQRVNGKQYRPPIKFSRFRPVSYLSGAALPSRSYAVFELPEGIAFRQEDSAKAASMLRSVAIRSAKADTHAFPEGSETYVAGHTGQRTQTPERFSYLPLPTIGHEHADGLIRRLLIAEPFGGNGAHAQWAQQRLRNEMLRDQDKNDRGVLLDCWRVTSQRMVDRYTSGGRSWCTVTPVILPGFDDGKLSKAEKLLFAALRQADLPTGGIAELTMRKAPFWPGSQHPRHYFTPAYLKHLPGWHVRLVFHEPIPGPLAIGAGRHAGLGIFARSEEE